MKRLPSKWMLQSASTRLTRIGARCAGIALILALSGCVASQNGQGGNAGNLTSALAVDEKTPKTAEAPKKDVSEKADASTALASEETSKKPAAAATKKIAETEPPKTQVAKKTQVEPEADDPPKTLFAALSRASNSSSTKQKKAKPASAVSKPKKIGTRKSVVVRRKGPPTGLPGVRKKTTIFGIITDSARNDDLDEPVEIASLPSQSRRGNFGLILQTANVKVHCFPRRLVRILKRVERKFGRTPIVTSGYRSRAKNRRIRGARNSVHISCKAADIQVPGVSKWKLARYLRSVPGRGGVGTYCHTKSVHIDIGKKRDWNWRCRRKKRSRS